MNTADDFVKLSPPDIPLPFYNYTVMTPISQAIFKLDLAHGL